MTGLGIVGVLGIGYSASAYRPGIGILGKLDNLYTGGAILLDHARYSTNVVLIIIIYFCVTRSHGNFSAA